MRTILRPLGVSTILGLSCLLLPAAALAQTPTISISDTTVIEADDPIFSSAVFNLKLSAPTSQPVSVTVTTTGGTAISDVDFVAGVITVTFDPGKTTQTVSVFVKYDSLVEAPEQFSVNLSNPINGTIAVGHAVATIVDDDSLSLVTEAGSQRAVALDSVFWTRDPFPIKNDFNFSSDHLTRISLFAIGLKLAAGEGASAVTATAEDPQGAIHPLAVDFLGKPNFQGFMQVVLKPTDPINTTGDLKIKITLHGETSNTVLVAVKPQ